MYIFGGLYNVYFWCTGVIHATAWGGVAEKFLLGWPLVWSSSQTNHQFCIKTEIKLRQNILFCYVWVAKQKSAIWLDADQLLLSCECLSPPLWWTWWQLLWKQRLTVLLAFTGVRHWQSTDPKPKYYNCEAEFTREWRSSSFCIPSEIDCLVLNEKKKCLIPAMSATQWWDQPALGNLQPEETARSALPPFPQLHLVDYIGGLYLP